MWVCLASDNLLARRFRKCVTTSSLLRGVYGRRLHCAELSWRQLPVLISIVMHYFASPLLDGSTIEIEEVRGKLYGFLIKKWNEDLFWCSNLLFKLTVTRKLEMHYLARKDVVPLSLPTAQQPS